MTTWPSFTVAVLSHRRPKLLRRVIGAVAQLDYPAFEIVVVGDQPDIGDYGLPPEIAGQIRYRFLAESNISRGRNLALSVAAGEIVAYCDDDAAPEPNWLRALALAFRRPDVGAASGTVLASDGLTVEWQGRYFSTAARDWPADLANDGVLFAEPDSQITDNRYLGLIGVNSAFRRKAALQAGGFDEAYLYFLEETDLAIRLARDGWSAALVREAIVHHLRAPNASRNATQVPRNLVQIAASKAYFCHRHLPEDRIPGELTRYREDRIRRLDPYVRLGSLRADGLKKFRRQVDRGLKEGAQRTAILPLSADVEPPALARFRCPGPSPRLRIALVSGWGALRITRVRRLARRLAAAGHHVSCFSFHSGAQPARVTFADGVWLHRGGTWRLDHWSEGRPVIRRLSRAMAEIGRVAHDRRFDVVVMPGRTGRGEGGTAVNLPPLPQLGSLVAQTMDGSAALPAHICQALIAALRSASGEASTIEPGATEPQDGRQAVSGNPSMRYS